MHNKSFVKYLALLTLVISVAIVWYKIIVTPDIPLPLLQGFGFTAIIAGFVWLVFGLPSKINNKYKSIEESTLPPDYDYRPTSSLNVKYNLKGFTKLALFLVFFALVVFLVLKITVVPKAPITSDQAWNIITEQGYYPQDITENYYKKDTDFKSVLEKCIAFEKDDIHFEFFDFNNKSSAVDLFSQAHSKILLAKNKFHIIETETQVANYAIYTLDDDDTYNVAIYVEDTAIYAYCNSENKNGINMILEKMDYLD